MSEKPQNETIADIRKETEARFRELVEAWMQRRTTFETTLGAMQAFNNLFDRLEAAHKREIDEAEARGLEAGGLVEASRYKPRGNVAALREALKLFVEQTCKRCRDEKRGSQGEEEGRPEMSRSNYDKPFYVDVGTSIVAVRCASNHDVVLQYDHSWRPSSIELAKTACDRMNKEAEIRYSGDRAKLREALVTLRENIHRSHENGCAVGPAYIGPAIVAEQIIDEALAAPLRNCDRPECATTKAATDVWRKEDGGKTAYYAWLLAPATDKEGGNK